MTGISAIMPTISLAQYRKSQDFAKSKGWIKDYYILANANKRADEPDLYLVTVFDHVTTPAEDEAREKEINAFLATSARQGDRESGARAKYRKLGGNMLLQELQYKYRECAVRAACRPLGPGLNARTSRRRRGTTATPSPAPLNRAPGSIRRWCAA